MQNSLGSGVIVSPDGIIVTNTHVVKVGGDGRDPYRAGRPARVRRQGRHAGREDRHRHAEDRGRRRALSRLEFENSDTLEVGDLVLAIGNPFGVGQTVTSGIISALARTEIGRSDAQVSSRRMPPSIPATRAARWSTWPAAGRHQHGDLLAARAARTASALPSPRTLIKLIVESAASGRKVERPWLGAKLECRHARDRRRPGAGPRRRAPWSRAHQRQGPGGQGRPAAGRRDRAGGWLRGHRSTRPSITA